METKKSIRLNRIFNPTNVNRDSLFGFGLFVVMSCLLMVNGNLGYGQNATDRPDCRRVEEVGNQNAELLKLVFNAALANQDVIINPRRTLHIVGVASLVFRRCDMNLRIEVVLRRRHLRDCHGFVDLRATVTEFSDHRVCFSKARVVKISMSHLHAPGRRKLKAWIESHLPEGKCHNY